MEEGKMKIYTEDAQKGMMVQYEDHKPIHYSQRYSIEELGRLIGLLAKRAVHQKAEDARRDISDAREYIEMIVGYLDVLEETIQKNQEVGSPQED